MTRSVSFTSDESIMWFIEDVRTSLYEYDSESSDNCQLPKDFLNDQWVPDTINDLFNELEEKILETLEQLMESGKIEILSDDNDDPMIDINEMDTTEQDLFCYLITVQSQGHGRGIFDGDLDHWFKPEHKDQYLQAISETLQPVVSEYLCEFSTGSIDTAIHNWLGSMSDLYKATERFTEINFAYGYDEDQRAIYITADFQGVEYDFPTKCGSNDSFEVWEDNTGIWVVSWSSGIGYIGCTRYTLDGDQLTTDESQEIFLQNSQDTDPVFGGSVGSYRGDTALIMLSYCMDRFDG